MATLTPAQQQQAIQEYEAKMAQAPQQNGPVLVAADPRFMQSRTVMEETQPANTGTHYDYQPVQPNITQEQAHIQQEPILRVAQLPSDIKEVLEHCVSDLGMSVATPENCFLQQLIREVLALKSQLTEALSLIQQLLPPSPPTQQHIVRQGATEPQPLVRPAYIEEDHHGKEEAVPKKKKKRNKQTKKGKLQRGSKVSEKPRRDAEKRGRNLGDGSYRSLSRSPRDEEE